MQDHITRYDRMPIPPVESQTEFFDAGCIAIGVEFRVLTEVVAAAHRATLADAEGDNGGKFVETEDYGVSLHVYGRADGEMLEYLRFDCFHEEPHYHYVSWSRRTNELLHIDPVADGDPLTWALDRIRHRLPQMLERAGSPKNAAMTDPREIEAIMPRVAEAAYRARFSSDRAAIRNTAEQSAARREPAPS